MLATLNSSQIVDAIVKDAVRDNDPHDVVQISPDIVLGLAARQRSTFGGAGNLVSRPEPTFAPESKINPEPKFNPAADLERPCPPSTQLYASRRAMVTARR